MRKSYMFFRVNSGSVRRHSKGYNGGKMAEIYLNKKYDSRTQARSIFSKQKI